MASRSGKKRTDGQGQASNHGTSSRALDRTDGRRTNAVQRIGPGGVPTQRLAQPASLKTPIGTLRQVKPAENYDVVSFARAMNADFPERVQTLFQPETDAAIAAANTGVYIGWRLPGMNFDCQRVSLASRCFCNHNLQDHEPVTLQKLKSNKLGRVKCLQCKCMDFAWAPSRPEDIGEFWFQRRRNFDVTTWRAKCRCKHTHDKHDCNGLRRCKTKGCGCGAFDSDFICAACDKHWEDHQTFFETESERVAAGLPIGEDYIPFAEIPSLKQMVLTGVDDQDMSYMKKIDAPDYSYAGMMKAKQERLGGRGRAIMGPGAQDIPSVSGRGNVDNSTPFAPNKPPGGGFRPVYD